MTFLELQDRIMARLNLSSDDARDRIKTLINERVRKMQTSCNLGRVRKSIITFNTEADVADYELIDALDEDEEFKIILPQTVRIPGQNRVLTGSTDDQIRVFDPSETARGVPRSFSVTSIGPDSVTMKLYPIPDGAYTIYVDGIRNGVDLIDDTDVPVFPEDFHDAIIYGVMADENTHFDKPDRDRYLEGKYEKRVSECRYFISRSIYLHRIQNGLSFDFSDSAWWWLYGSPSIQA